MFRLNTKPSSNGICHGITRKDGTRARTSQISFNFFIVTYVPNFLTVMCVPFSVFCVLFVCKCVLYCCHWMSTQLQFYIYIYIYTQYSRRSLSCTLPHQNNACISLPPACHMSGPSHSPLFDHPDNVVFSKNEAPHHAVFSRPMSLLYSSVPYSRTP
jgi:hypothetical protein